MAIPRDLGDEGKRGESRKCMHGHFSVDSVPPWYLDVRQDQISWTSEAQRNRRCAIECNFTIDFVAAEPLGDHVKRLTVSVRLPELPALGPIALGAPECGLASSGHSQTKEKPQGTQGHAIDGQALIAGAVGGPDYEPPGIAATCVLMLL